jgi:hypothetical protein
MLNYFNYFTEIEHRFQQRRGSLLMLSTLDWALIETWREAGLPLEIVLRGIDNAFDKHDAQKLRAGARRQRKINGLAWAAQAVMHAAQEAAEAATGTLRQAEKREQDTGFETDRIRLFLAANADRIDQAHGDPAIAARLRELAQAPETHLEDLDRTLTVLEQKMVAGLMASASEEEMVALREQAARELAPYRGKMQAVQIRQVQDQFLHKRLLEARNLPRLSLFYMPQS